MWHFTSLHSSDVFLLTSLSKLLWIIIREVSSSKLCDLAYDTVSFLCSPPTHLYGVHNPEDNTFKFHLSGRCKSFWEQENTRTGRRLCGTSPRQ